MKTYGESTRTMRLDLLLEDHRKEASISVSPNDSKRIDTIDDSVMTADFNTLLQSLYDAALLADFTGNISNANERALRFFDLNREALLGRPIESLIAGASRDILSTVISNVQSERFTLLQAYCIRSDGSLFPAEISVTCLRFSPQPLLCFFIRDITLRRGIETQLRIEQGAVHNAGSGIAISDPDGNVSYVNPAMCHLWLCSPGTEMLKCRMDSLFCDRKAFTHAMEETLVKSTWSGELEARRSDGSSFYVQTSITSCLDEDQTITHLVFSFADTTKRRLDEEALRRYQDHLEDLIRERTSNLETSNLDLTNEITERVRAESELHEAIRKLHEHDQAKSQFVSNVSHELRTPLTSLIHAVENLMRGIPCSVPDAAYSYLTMMLEDCWRLNRTVCDILDLSRIESGTLNLNTACTPFRRMIERTTETLQLEAEDAALTLRIEPGSASTFVLCDVAKIERVCTNIIGNAIKFTPAGGLITVAILEQDRQGNRGACCQITDSGTGIPPQYLHRVTERFFRVGEQVGGTGLGLAIAKEIIKHHQGILEITSPPPGAPNGTQVTFWLPSTPPPQVMVVTPDTEFQTMLVLALQRRGYCTALYNNAHHAMQMLHDGKQNIVIVDHSTPDMDGTEFIMHIKANALLRTLPVLLLTDENPSPSFSSILQNFDIPVFCKPHRIDELVAAVEGALLPQHSGFSYRLIRQEGNYQQTA